MVIAIIGILSATVLTALGPSRNRAKDARIISNLQQVRAVAETLYDGDYDAVNLQQADIARAAEDINDNQGTLVINKEATPALNYAAYSDLATGGKWYCVDSVGVAKELTGESDPVGGATACP